MFNLSGSEIVALVLLALVVLGPEKLPEAIRRFGRTYGELKKMSTGFQNELKSALDEPMREMRETADLLRKSADFGELDGLGKTKPKSAEMAAATPRSKSPADASTPTPDEPVKEAPAEAATDDDTTDDTTDDTGQAQPSEPAATSAPTGPAFHSAAPRARKPKATTTGGGDAAAGPSVDGVAGGNDTIEGTATA